MSVRKEIVSGLVLFLFGAGFLFYDARYPLDDWANPGPAVFPLMVGTVLVILSFGQVIRASRKLNPPGREAKILSARESIRPSRGDMKVLLMIAVFIVYLTLIRWVGFFVSNFLFVVIASRLMAARDWRGPVALSLGVNLFCYLLFELWLKLSFPRGILF